MEHIPEPESEPRFNPESIATNLILIIVCVLLIADWILPNALIHGLATILLFAVICYMCYACAATRSRAKSAKRKVDPWRMFQR